MTWRLIHDSETVGEWSEDLIDKIVKELCIRSPHYLNLKALIKAKVSI